MVLFFDVFCLNIGMYLPILPDLRHLFSLSLFCLRWCKPSIVYWSKKRHQNHSQHHGNKSTDNRHWYQCNSQLSWHSCIIVYVSKVKNHTTLEPTKLDILQVKYVLMHPTVHDWTPVPTTDGFIHVGCCRVSTINDITSGASSAAETGEEAGGVPCCNGAWSGAWFTIGTMCVDMGFIEIQR